MKPDFAGAAGGPAPASFNPQGAANFGAQVPPPTSWSPSAAPTPGAIPPTLPSDMSDSPVPPAAPMPQVMPASPMGGPASPAPAPTPMSAAPAPRPASPSIEAVAASVPPPPSSAEFEVRTMKSDTESLKQTGGGAPMPQTFSPASLADNVPAFDPNSATSGKKDKKGVEKIIIMIVVVVGLIGAGILGYMLIKPLLVPAAPAPVVTAPEAEILPPVELPPAAPEEELPATIAHASFFTLAADSTDDRILPALTLADIKTALAPTGTPADTSLREVVMKVETTPVILPDFIATVIPGMNAEAVATVFEPDFTTFVYRDKTTDLPGFIGKVKADATPESMVAFSSSLEASTELGNLYPEDPGAIGEFKDGAINGKTVKYASFANGGYAFDYGWFKAADGSNYIVISSSYAGMKEAVRRAGF